jgi:hypothetical protein
VRTSGGAIGISAAGMEVALENIKITGHKMLPKTLEASILD